MNTKNIILILFLVIIVASSITIYTEIIKENNIKTTESNKEELATVGLYVENQQESETNERP